VKELSLHLLDLIENAAEAAASRVEITITEDPARDRLRICVSDDGRGMAPDLLAGAADPFVTTRSTRAVGLGLALLASAAAQAGGRLRVSSAPGAGAQVVAEFQLSHIDRAPLGALGSTLAAAALLHPDLRLRLRHRGPGGAYQVTPPSRLRRRPLALARHIEARTAAGRRRIGSIA